VKAREDLLLLLYCKTAGSSRKINAKQFEFAIPLALTLAEGGKTIAQRRAGEPHVSLVAHASEG
jgi:hypothetical protein